MDAAAEKRLFEERDIGDALLRLALPTVAGQIVLVIYNLADTFFIGMTGDDEKLAAVTVCLPAFMALSAIANLFGIGGGSVIARALGQGSRERAQRTAAFAFWGCALTALAYSLLTLLALDPFIDLLGGTAPAVHAYCREYLRCTVVFGGLTTAGGMLLSHLVRAEGNAAQASAGIMLGGVLNIALDPLFMFRLLPAGREALGAAVATALSNAVTAAYFLTLLRAKKSGETCIALRPSRAALGDGIPAAVLRAGLPACMMTLMENVSYAVLDKLMSLGGTQLQTGVGVAKKINMLAHCIVRGIAQGALPLIGYNYAARRYVRMRKAVLAAGAFAVSAALLCTAACLAFSGPLVDIFLRADSPSAPYAARFLRILCLGGPFSAWAYTVISFFQATGKGHPSFCLAMMRKGCVDIPVMFALCAAASPQATVWATPFADALCCAVSVCLFAAFLARHTECAPVSGPRPAHAVPLRRGVRG